MAEDKPIAKENITGSYKFTVHKVTGLKQGGFSSFTPTFYVSVQIGDRIYQTKASATVALPEWNETFTFTTTRNDLTTIRINLCQTGFFKFLDNLLGSVTMRLADFEPRNQEVERSIQMKDQSQVTITLKAGDTFFTGPKCRVFALIIGIDQYANSQIDNLRGCVNDAKAFKSFLTEFLRVPDSQIKLLMNGAATRSGILNAFDKYLVMNTHIDKDDAIIFFYAGHGSRVTAPEDWLSTDGKIETLCPYDDRMKDEKGHDIHGILDRTINAKLRKLAAEKGDNITVIFDSCHSGGITRTIPDNIMPTMRYVETPSDIKIPPSLDSDIWGSSRAVEACIPVGFQQRHMASHILLAACRQEQLAEESLTAGGLVHGFFTNSLIKQLRIARLDCITYVDLLNRLPVKTNQIPQCEGENKKSILFNGKVMGTNESAFKLAATREEIKVQAGSIHGVVVGTEFVVLDATLSSRHRYLGSLVAITVSSYSSILGYRPGAERFEVPQEGEAVVSDWKNDVFTMKVAVESDVDDLLALALFPALDPTQPDQLERILQRSFVKVDSRNNANIVVNLKRDSAGDQTLVIERLDALILDHASITIQFNAGNSLNCFPYIFSAIAHFNYHLARRGDDISQRGVSVELFKLKRHSDGEAWIPESENLFVENDATRLLAEEEVRYGLAITNGSRYNLFPYLFYFDPLDYSITDFFLPPATTCAAPLRSQTSTPTKVTIGYGAGGGDPLVFTLRPGKTSETGFFKLFVSSKYVDMDLIKQQSAFDSCEAYNRLVTRRADEADIWGTWITAVTVYK